MQEEQCKHAQLVQKQNYTFILLCLILVVINPHLEDIMHHSIFGYSKKTPKFVKFLQNKS